MARRPEQRRNRFPVAYFFPLPDTAPPPAPAAPVNTTSPAMTGTFAVTGFVALDFGTWSGWPSPTFTWQILDSADGDAEIANGDQSTTTYQWQAGDEGAEPFLRVTATNSEGSDVADSIVYGPITGEPEPPVENAWELNGGGSWELNDGIGVWELN